MTEINGLECSHVDCPAREWVDGPTVKEWVPVTITVGGQEYTAHYCPKHGAGLVNNTHMVPVVPNINLAAQFGERVGIALSDSRETSNDHHEVAVKLDTANTADLVKAGFAEKDITPAPFPPVMPDAVSSLPDPDQWAAPTGPPTPPAGEPTQALDIVPVKDVFKSGETEPTTTKTRRGRSRPSSVQRAAGTVGAMLVAAFLAVGQALDTLVR